MYRCEATTIAGFIQQLAVSYVGSGYWFYVTARIPEKKDPRAVDEKLIDRYGLARSRATRSRRKQAGLANVQYLRHRRFFVLLATKGVHPFFEEEPFRDIRRQPFRYAGYSVSYRRSTVTCRWHPSVRIDREEYLRVKAHFLEISCKRSADSLGRELGRIPFEPYAPVRRQFLNILRAVNRSRAAAGRELVPVSCLRLRRSPVRVFEPPPVAAPAEGWV